VKYRSGFVTNSSSSSYIVAYKNTEKNKELTESFFDYKYKTKENLAKCILKFFGCHTLEEALKNEQAKKYYDRMAKFIRKGYVVAEKRIDFYDCDTQEQLELLIKNGNAVLIEEF